MNPAFRLPLGAALAAFLLAADPNAQAQIVPISVTQPTAAQDLRVTSAVGSQATAPGFTRLKLAQEGGLQSSGGSSGVGLAPAFSNVDASTFFATVPNGKEYLDWGVITTDTGSDLVGSFTFGYGTVIQDQSVGGPGASVNLRFYDGAQGSCSDAGQAPIASFTLTGLPGSTAVGNISLQIVEVDLSGGFEFCHGGPGSAFGFGISSMDNNKTGPILCYAGDGLGGPDANGQSDLFDIYDGTVQTGLCTGTFFFGGPPMDFASWYLQIDSVDTAISPEASATKRNTVNPDAYDPTADPIIGGLYQATVASSAGGNAVLLGVGFSASTQPTVFGDLLIDTSGVFLLGPFAISNGVANVSQPISKDLSQAGTFLATQSVELGGGVPQLHNAVDLVLGF